MEKFENINNGEKGGGMNVLRVAIPTEVASRNVSIVTMCKLPDRWLASLERLLLYIVDMYRYFTHVIYICI